MAFERYESGKKTVYICKKKLFGGNEEIFQTISSLYLYLDGKDFTIVQNKIHYIMANHNLLVAKFRVQ